MANEYFVLVTGNGETSRANIEALMEDHYYAKGADGTLVLAYEKVPTKSQILTAQYAKACEKNIVVFCHEDATTLGMHGVTQNATADPVTDSIKFVAGKDAVAFLLWDEHDDQCFGALKKCIEWKVSASNLCDGLVPLNDIIKSPIADRVEVTEIDEVAITLDTSINHPVTIPSPTSIELLEKELNDVLARARAIVGEMIICRQNSL